jgi:hypothetical protein
MNDESEELTPDSSFIILHSSLLPLPKLGKIPPYYIITATLVPKPCPEPVEGSGLGTRVAAQEYIFLGEQSLP